MATTPVCSGTVRKLPSGRYQARLRRGDTGRQETVGTYRSKADADAALRAAEAALAAGRWVDPARGRITLKQYTEAWLAERSRLAPRTREIYAGLLRVHILPILGDVRLDRLTPSEVRRWHRERSEGPSPSMAPKAYRLLRTILTTAVDDELIARNPCRIRSAGVDRSTAQQVVSIPQLYAIADAIAPRYRALVLVVGLAGLRGGELFALTRADIDLERGTVDVNKQRVRLDSGEVLVTSPKTDAGRRIVALPHVVVARSRGSPRQLRWPVDNRSRLHRHARRSPGPNELPRSVLEAGDRCSRRADPASTRSPPHRRHPGGDHRCLHEGADGPTRPRQPPRCAHLPTRHP